MKVLYLFFFLSLFFSFRSGRGFFGYGFTTTVRSLQISLRVIRYVAGRIMQIRRGERRTRSRCKRQFQRDGIASSANVVESASVTQTRHFMRLR